MGDYVILLHGLARTARFMRPIEKYLTKQRYEVINVDYPSRKKSIEELAQNYITKAVQQCQKEKKIHFVCHSMGGLLVRFFLKNNTLPNLGKVVMLGTPNQGSELADCLKNNFIFRWFFGPAGQQLGTKKEILPQQMGPVHFDLGVIAGEKTWNFLAAWILKNPNDGRVTVDRSKIEGMKQHIILPLTHDSLVWSKKSHQQILHFLQQGSFLELGRV